jgi:hypothetical protein
MDNQGYKPRNVGETIFFTEVTELPIGEVVSTTSLVLGSRFQVDFGQRPCSHVVGPTLTSFLSFLSRFTYYFTTIKKARSWFGDQAKFTYLLIISQ